MMAINGWAKLGNFFLQMAASQRSARLSQSRLRMLDSSKSLPTGLGGRRSVNDRTRIEAEILRCPAEPRLDLEFSPSVFPLPTPTSWGDVRSTALLRGGATVGI